IRKALEEPLRLIAVNSGKEGNVVVANVRRNGTGAYGYDALRDEYGDLFEKGIIDPAKVTRSALENAASIAALVLTTESLVTDSPADSSPVPRNPVAGLPSPVPRALPRAPALPCIGSAHPAVLRTGCRPGRRPSLPCQPSLLLRVCNSTGAGRLAPPVYGDNRV